LPQPLGPMIDTNSPVATEKETESKASRGPTPFPGGLKLLRTPRTLSDKACVGVALTT
jgi:hypothetical protein